MRTAIYMGLLSVADAIRADWIKEGNAGFFAMAFIVFALMDIIEFIFKLIKK